MNKLIYITSLSALLGLFGCQSNEVDTVGKNNQLIEAKGEDQVDNQVDSSEEKGEIEETNDEDKSENYGNEEDLEEAELPEDVEKAAEIIAFEAFKSSDSSPEDVVTGLEYADNVLSVTVVGREGWSDKSMGLGFYEDSTTFYRKLSEYDELEEVWLSITFPMMDAYGNEDYEEVMVTWMSRETLDKINWSNFYFGDLLDVVDGMRVFPEFVQD